MRALFVMVLVLAGCGRNEELRARLADEERQLAEHQALAAKLNEDRRALEAAEQDLANALSQFPEEKAAIDALEAPPFTKAMVPTFPPLPHESLFDGSDRARLRRQLQDVEARIVELSKVIAEAEKLHARTREVQRKLELVRERGALRKP